MMRTNKVFFIFKTPYEKQTTIMFMWCSIFVDFCTPWGISVIFYTLLELLALLFLLYVLVYVALAFLLVLFTCWERLKTEEQKAQERQQWLEQKEQERQQWMKDNGFTETGLSIGRVAEP